MDWRSCRHHKVSEEVRYKMRTINRIYAMPILAALLYVLHAGTPAYGRSDVGVNLNVNLGPPPVIVSPPPGARFDPGNGDLFHPGQGSGYLLLRGVLVSAPGPEMVSRNLPERPVGDR
jgi:hypothetical protein